MIACFVPLVEFDGVFVAHLVGKPDQIGYFGSQHLLDAMDRDKIDRALPAALINGAVFCFTNIVVENKVIHFFGSFFCSIQL